MLCRSVVGLPQGLLSLVSRLSALPYKVLSYEYHVAGGFALYNHHQKGEEEV